MGSDKHMFDIWHLNKYTAALQIAAILLQFAVLQQKSNFLSHMAQALLNLGLQ